MASYWTQYSKETGIIGICRDFYCRKCPQEEKILDMLYVFVILMLLLGLGILEEGHKIKKTKILDNPIEQLKFISVVDIS